MQLYSTLKIVTNNKWNFAQLSTNSSNSVSWPLST